MRKSAVIVSIAVMVAAMTVLFSTGSNSQDSVSDLPEEYRAAQVPEKLSDQEIDSIGQDIDGIDTENGESAYGEDPVDIEQGPALEYEDEAIYNTIIENPYDSEYQWMEDDWLYDHPVVVYYIFKNYYWIDDHPDIGLWLYARPLFIWSDPYVAFAAYGNYVFLNRYPQYAIPLYMNVTWLHRHPFIAERVFINEKFLSVYPKVAGALYGDEGWFLAHHRVARIAYRNKSILKEHPHIAQGAYRYRSFMMSHPGYQFTYKQHTKSGLQYHYKSPRNQGGNYGGKQYQWHESPKSYGDGYKTGKIHMRREHAVDSWQKGGGDSPAGGKSLHLHALPGVKNPGPVLNGKHR